MTRRIEFREWAPGLLTVPGRYLGGPSRVCNPGSCTCPARLGPRSQGATDKQPNSGNRKQGRRRRLRVRDRRRPRGPRHRPPHPGAPRAPRTCSCRLHPRGRGLGKPGGSRGRPVAAAPAALRPRRRPGCALGERAGSARLHRPLRPPGRLDWPVHSPGENAAVLLVAEADGAQADRALLAFLAFAALHQAVPGLR